jgi:hypothetical protein
MPKVYYCPLGENLPNLVTLATADGKMVLCHSKNRLKPIRQNVSTSSIHTKIVFLSSKKLPLYTLAGFDLTT